MNHLAQKVGPFGAHSIGDLREFRDAGRVVAVDALATTQRAFVNANPFENDHRCAAFCASAVIVDMALTGQVINTEVSRVRGYEHPVTQRDAPELERLKDIRKSWVSHNAPSVLRQRMVANSSEEFNA